MEEKSRAYNHTEVEKKWQERWEKDGIYTTESEKSTKPKMYVLDMFPYPSGAGLHVGHPRGYIASDVFSRYKRMQGFNVLHPMGFDSFGLPAEQYAIKTGNHPGPYTDELVVHYKKQLSNIGFSYDWSREVATHRPEYYKWTQWIFLKLFNSWYNPESNKTEPIQTCIEKLSKQDKQWEAYCEKEKQDILMQYRIAYEGYAEVNWCPELGTVLANDEIITAPDGTMVSERGEHPVVRKSMRQWFMRISAYADRLLSGLDTIDWPHGIKEIQRNWIGKSEGSEIPFKLSTGDTVSVFTTRADTLFGVTYLVLAPEHQLVEELLVNSNHQITNSNEVEAYIAKVKATSEDDRTNDKNEKTGICLEGVTAINPANGEEVPVWIANYVLANYGTGAVMAVPAHDERDFEFAKKYYLPIKKVIQQRKKERVFFLTKSLIPNWQEKIKNIEWGLFDNWGVEFFVDDFEKEKTLFQEIIQDGPWYFDVNGRQNLIVFKDIFFDAFSEDKESIISYAKSKNIEEKDLEFYKWYIKAFPKYGYLTNSNQFDGLTSEEAKKKITEFVGGRLVTKYKMRDAIFARQRYWGEPIPLRHSADGIITALSEEELPLVLPELPDFAPAGDGNSALSKSKEWMEKGYETNTMPGWAGSSWYFLRYMDPHNAEAFASFEAVKYWGQVDMYVGGAEHATGHLLYSRFWNMALHDLGYVPHAEPFKTLRNQGMIAGTDGRKMSKRWGNIINPDDVVAQLGADTLRVYESFMGPFESHLPWSTDGIVGSRRFLERVYRVIDTKIADTTDPSVTKALHKAIKKVTNDINSFSFNTAVSAMMIWLNELEKGNGITKKDFSTFLQLLAPFAPHITEELWQELGEGRALEDGARHNPAGSSIHLASWPTYDEALTKDDEVTLGVQINGKLRAEVTVPADAGEDIVREAVFALPRIQELLSGQEPKKTIVVPGRIVNIVL